MPSFLNPLLEKSDRKQLLTNERTGTIVASDLLTAFDSASRRTGLLGHTTLPEGTALIIAPCNAIHTIRMRFDIDVAFVAKDGRIVKLRHAVPPWRMAASLGAFAVIEMAAGTFARRDVKVGDKLMVAGTDR
jgi:uncharacterized membrane protein (UPF0127 family)